MGQQPFRVTFAGSRTLYFVKQKEMYGAWERILRYSSESHAAAGSTADEAPCGQRGCDTIGPVPVSAVTGGHETGRTGKSGVGRPSAAIWEGGFTRAPLC
jgi:hypothetical protein